VLYAICFDHLPNARRCFCCFRTTFSGEVVPGSNPVITLVVVVLPSSQSVGLGIHNCSALALWLDRWRASVTRIPSFPARVEHTARTGGRVPRTASATASAASGMQEPAIRPDMRLTMPPIVVVAERRAGRTTGALQSGGIWVSPGFGLSALWILPSSACHRVLSQRTLFALRAILAKPASLIPRLSLILVTIRHLVRAGSTESGAPTQSSRAAGEVPGQGCLGCQSGTTSRTVLSSSSIQIVFVV